MLRKIITLSTSRANVRPTSSIRHSSEQISLNRYQEISDNTLEELSDKFDTILEDRYDRGADVSLNNGVLTVVVDSHNIYVINKQTPNKQIWLSSPMSGPKRFDLISDRWVEKNSKTELKKLLSDEFTRLLGNQVEI